MNRLTVVGAGSMGAQIAQQAALHGLDVILNDTSEEQLRKAAESNRGHLMRRVEKGKLSAAEAQSALGRVRPVTDLAEAVNGTEFVIEAGVEDLHIKRPIFAPLHRGAPPRARPAHHPSNMGISKNARSTTRPQPCGYIAF